MKPLPIIIGLVTLAVIVAGVSFVRGITGSSGSHQQNTHLQVHPTVIPSPVEKVLYYTDWSQGLKNWYPMEHTSGWDGSQITSNNYLSPENWQLVGDRGLVLLKNKDTTLTPDYYLEAPIIKMGQNYAVEALIHAQWVTTRSDVGKFGFILAHQFNLQANSIVDLSYPLLVGDYCVLIRNVLLNPLPEGHLSVKNLRYVSDQIVVLPHNHTFNGESYASEGFAYSYKLRETGYHLYRVEVRGKNLRFLIDGFPFLNVTDGTFADDNRIAIYIWDVQSFELKSFKVVALP